ncbi:NAD(P)-binding domain-containing protein (plasmid) [Streptomyces sp. NBC_01278]|uniref:lactate/malate family dehydrogenase n=1 Tax=Streptomyces sp. NBC_01278 TaxID=2903809 RepID=UPI002E351F93|nr:NAD(P)-binding domain-containing protein [Streptomyces sp. NBC_01278]
MTATIGIIGAGAIGQAVATTLVASGITDRLLLSSRTVMQAQALTDDTNDMRASTGSRTVASAHRPEDVTEAPAIILAIRERFTNNNATDIRMAGAHANARAVLDLGRRLRGYTGTVLIVTNPVDLMTRLFAEASGCQRVYGIGSNLDTARYRLLLGAWLGVPADQVRGHVIGEHGDSAVVCASTTTVGGRPAAVPVRDMRTALGRRPGSITSGVGRTRSGPAGAVLATLRLALGHSDGTTELSTEWNGHWLGVPVHFEQTRPRVLMPPLDAVETELFARSGRKLETAYRNLPITRTKENSR